MSSLGERDKIDLNTSLQKNIRAKNSPIIENYVGSIPTFFQGSSLIW